MITINSIPTSPSLSNNPIIYKATSSIYSTLYFKYRIDIYIDDTLISTHKFLPLSDGSISMDIKRIVQDYMGIYFPYTENVLSFPSAKTMTVKSHCVIWEEVNGTASNSAQTDITYINYGGLEFDEWLDKSTYYDSVYVPTGQIIKFLSHNKTEYDMLPNEYEIGYAITSSYSGTQSDDIKSVDYNIYDSVGTLKLNYLKTNIGYMDITGTTTRILTFPTGAKNLGSHIDPTDSYYTVALRDGAGRLKSDIYVFNLVHCKQKWDKISLYYLNKMGAMSQIWFNLKDVRTITTDMVEYDKFVPHNYSVTSRGLETFNTRAYESYELLSDWMTQSDVDCFEELIQSPQVYMFVYSDLVNDPKVHPVVISGGENVIKNIRKDRMTQYKIQVRKSNKMISLR